MQDMSWYPKGSHQRIFTIKWYTLYILPLIPAVSSKEPFSSLSLIALLVPSTKIFHMDVSYFLGQFYRKPSLIILNSRHLHLRGNMIWTHQQMQQENKMAAKNWIPTYQTTILFVFTSWPPPCPRPPTQGRLSRPWQPRLVGPPCPHHLGAMGSIWDALGTI